MANVRPQYLGLQSIQAGFVAAPDLNSWLTQTVVNAASRTLESQFHQFETQYLALTDGLVHVRLDR